MGYVKIVYYKSKANRSPIEEFFEKLPTNVAARFYDYFQHLFDHGGRLTQGSAFKKLHNYPMEEIRVKQGKNLYRVIIHVKINTLILILHEFTKKEGEKTPSKELDIAYKRLKELHPSLNA